MEYKFFKFFYTISRHGRYPSHRSALHYRSLKLFFDVFLHHAKPLFIHCVAFIKHQDCLFYAKKPKYIKMFLSLRHDSLICRHYHEYKVHADYSGNHVIYKFLMPRHIYDTASGMVFKVKPGKSKLNGNTTLLFFLKPVGITPCKCMYEGGLAMVYMSCSSYNNMFH